MKQYYKYLIPLAIAGTALFLFQNCSSGGVSDTIDGVAVAP